MQPADTMPTGDTGGRRAPMSGRVTLAHAPVQVRLQTDLATPLVVGSAVVLPLIGWYTGDSPLGPLVPRNPTVLVDGVVPIRANELVHAVTVREGPEVAEFGFCAFLPFAAIQTPRDVSLALRVRLNGAVHEFALGTLRLVLPSPQITRPSFVQPVARPARVGEPRVTICMATYNPPLDLFASQVESLQAQWHRNWMCLVSDDCSDPEIYAGMKRILSGDEHFQLYRSPERRGFYRNFETCLALVPEETDFVALADQDDVWFTHKVDTLVAALGETGATTNTTTGNTTTGNTTTGNTTTGASTNGDVSAEPVMLAYSDMHIWERDGRVRHRTFWTNRRNNYTDLSALIWANTVTGAATAFRRELLKEILPFPERVGNLFHDHWIASVALARGRIAYVDEPLYAYRQHGESVIGHVEQLPSQRPRLTTLLRMLVSPAFLKAKGAAVLWSRVDGYYLNVLRTALIAKTLQLRAVASSEEKRAIVRRLARSDRSGLTLLRESALAKLQRRPTLDTEWFGARGACANWALFRLNAVARMSPPPVWRCLGRLRPDARFLDRRHETHRMSDPLVHRK